MEIAAYDSFDRTIIVTTTDTWRNPFHLGVRPMDMDEKAVNYPCHPWWKTSSPATLTTPFTLLHWQRHRSEFGGVDVRWALLAANSIGIQDKMEATDSKFRMAEALQSKVVIPPPRCLTNFQADVQRLQHA